MELYRKLHKIQKAVTALKKNAQGHGYQYLNGEKLLDHIKPLMNEHGLLLKQEILSIENERMDYTTGAGKPKSEILSKVMLRFTWIDSETGEKDENLFGANGQNDWDKGVGSALTYGERYFLLKYFHIATDEDDVDNPINKQGKEDPQPKQPESNKQPEPPKILDLINEYNNLVEQNKDLYTADELAKLNPKVDWDEKKYAANIAALKQGIEKRKAAKNA